MNSIKVYTNGRLEEFTAGDRFEIENEKGTYFRWRVYGYNKNGKHQIGGYFRECDERYAQQYADTLNAKLKALESGT